MGMTPRHGWPEATPLDTAVREYVEALTRADAERLDHDCGEALELTAPGCRNRLFIVIDVSQTGMPTLGHVACWVP